MGAKATLVAIALAATLSGCSGATTTGDPAAPAAAPEAAPEVESIIERMRERYRGARTYSEEGTLRDVSLTTTGEVTSTTTGRFQTRWLQPDRLRFEMQTKGRYAERTLAVWTPTGGVKALASNRLSDEVSLDSALGALQGVSHGITGLAPRWLADGGFSSRLRYELRKTGLFRADERRASSSRRSAAKTVE